MFLLTCTLEKECRSGVEILYVKRKSFVGKIFIKNEIQVEYVFWKIMADERNVSTIVKVLIWYLFQQLTKTEVTWEIIFFFLIEIFGNTKIYQFLAFLSVFRQSQSI